MLVGFHLARLQSLRRSDVRLAAAGSVDGASIGKQLPRMLPSSIPGGVLYQRNFIDDGMAVRLPHVLDHHDHEPKLAGDRRGTAARADRQ
jgi:hypothetical protein